MTSLQQRDVGDDRTCLPPRVTLHQHTPSAHLLNIDSRQGNGAPVASGGRVAWLPMALQAGGAYHWSLAGATRVGASLETRMTRGRPSVAMLGGELTHPTGAALRLGVRVNDDASRFSAGAGYALAALRLDYAFVADRLDIGDSHRISFTAGF